MPELVPENLTSMVLEPAIATESSTYVTQSRFFNPAFNAAIFDGPIRIYFAQYQESQALKLYFNLQERFSDVRKQARGVYKERGSNIFVMIYPSEDLFEESFAADGASAASTDSRGSLFVRSRLGSDYVVGVRGPLEDEDLENICREMDQIISLETSSPLGVSV